ncbi:class I SAM-dependent methyltransferase [Oscillibacter valericigenes]|jgi:2-polyprenyl-6-hydroxyphenyl methylase/3-demethylubiquinone-9 3-methyltransferase|nr:class I SAM-dependent methyltransferase [Oscillibacter ruminantium]MDN0033246.1 class I SAM-dependent methyltransferase [Oscillibacter valericigenes]MEA5041618.1 class I SAM-dependent methyltransferase [Oscillibacter ruminantium]
MNYYSEKLNAQTLFQVYETQIPRVKQYLQAEIEFVKRNLSKGQRVLELGAGYGRIVRELSPFCGSIVGIDISEENVALGRDYLKDYPNAGMVVMDVFQMNFPQAFDVILCLQNGLSAMRADSTVIHKVLETLAPGGTAYFSSYSAQFWDVRLKWFEEQASKGLLGEIDYGKSRNGVIICKDGFQSSTHSPEDFQEIGKRSGYPYQVREVDESSVFLIIHKK